ncbi:hypothetical protein ACFLUB_01160 [Chloroflexota bacterium]
MGSHRGASAPLKTSRGAGIKTVGQAENAARVAGWEKIADEKGRRGGLGYLVGFKI